MWPILMVAGAQGVMLKARVEEAFAEEVDRWARAHDVDRSEAIRIALRRLLDAEKEHARRMREIQARFASYEDAGAFEPPEDDSWKASGGWS